MSKIKSAVMVVMLLCITVITAEQVNNINRVDVQEVEYCSSLSIAIPTSTPSPTPTPIPNPMIEYYQDHFKVSLDSVSVSAVYMKFEYIGDYYITAYCPEECGYRTYSDGSDNYPTGWVTSTGTVCHREEEWWNPSTCGINTSINHYGDLFLIDGKVFVAEDTGPGAVGHWIDTFMPDYESMASFGSHWTEVYSVSYSETESVTGWHFDINSFNS
jgi:3D (Asp-Asp-Asp) domain-containing protein